MDQGTHPLLAATRGLTAIAAFAVAIGVAAASEDLVKFRSGNEVRCRVLQYKNGMLTCETGEGKKQQTRLTAVAEILFDVENEAPAPAEEFSLPTTVDEWDAIRAKTVKVDIQKYAKGKSTGVRVKSGDRLRVVPHPFDQWGGNPYGLEYWNGDHCHFAVGIPGKSQWIDARSLVDQAMIYKAPVDGTLHIKTSRKVPSGFVGHLKGSISVKIVKVK